MKPMGKGRRASFTLVELLTVIAIIIILVGLIMIAVVAAQESGRNTNCRNNLRQLHELMLQYTTTYGGYLPAFFHERWVGELRLAGPQWGSMPDDLNKLVPICWNNNSGTAPFFGIERPLVRSGAPFLLCKSDVTMFRCDQGCLVSYMGLAKYGFWCRGGEIQWATSPTYQYHLLSEFDNTSKRLMLMETEPGTWQYNPTNCGCRWHAFTQSVEIVVRHFGGGNVLFMDGHIELIREAAKRQIAYWEPDYKSVNEGTMGWD